MYDIQKYQKIIYFLFQKMKKLSIFASAFREYLMRHLEKWQSGRMRQSWKLLTVTGPGVRIPLSPQKETHKIFCGFFSSQKTKLVWVFWELKKTKILGKNLGFYACSGFPIWMHAVNPDLFILVWVFWKLKKTKILGKNLGFYACSGFPIGMHGVNPDLFILVWVFGN